MNAAHVARIPGPMKLFLESGTIEGAVTLIQRNAVLAGLETVGYHDPETKELMHHDLRTHTSGMYGVKPPALGRLRLLMEKSLAEVVATGSQQPLDFEPGAKWEYSNMAIPTAARILEGVAGLSYEGFMEAHIFRPLGMRDTFIFPTRVYELENGKLRVARDPSGFDLKYRKGAHYPRPEAAFYSTATDLAQFYQMLLNGGTLNGRRILSRSSVDVMTELHTGAIKASNNFSGNQERNAFVVICRLGNRVMTSRFGGK